MGRCLWKIRAAEQRREISEHVRDIACGALIFCFAVFFCWVEIGRYGVFGSAVDWISQHSVIPEYFRQQFYATGKLFQEFAPELGGGQNVYHFAYYGLYSPLILPSYLLPFVKMGDYLMAVSVLCVASGGVIFYGWLRSQRSFGGDRARQEVFGRGVSGARQAVFGEGAGGAQCAFSRGVCFGAAMLLVLSGPMIFQSARQVMFVNYMPFLCMALWGVDRYFAQGKCGLYLLGVFLMIMTSFYYSVGGMLALVLYGLYRYLSFEWRKEGGLLRRCIRFLGDGLRFLLPMLTAVLLSAFLLVPAAAALAGKRGGAETEPLVSLLTPEISVFRFLYSAYGPGMTTLFITALFAGLFCRERSRRVLSWGCAAVLTFPVVLWLLNGGLYVREKALIPFLPLFCYAAALYCAQAGKVLNGEGQALALLPYMITIFLLYVESGYTAADYLAAASRLPEELQSGGLISRAGRWTLVLLDAALMLLWYAGLRYFFRGRKTGGGRLPKRVQESLLLVPPLIFLVLFGTSFRGTVRVASREFYEEVNDEAIGEAVKRVLAEDDGFFRTEQLGSASQRAANINRVWTAGQYLTSLYASSFNSDYQTFRMETFDVEEPAVNFMMQRVSDNPVFQKLMGVKYLLEPVPDSAAADVPTGYELYAQDGKIAVYRNENVAPICYATDKVISEDAYRALEFPLNQTVLEHYAVSRMGCVESRNETAQDEEKDGWLQQERERLAQAELSLESAETDGFVEKIQGGYRVQADKTQTIAAAVRVNDSPKEAESFDTLYLQFRIKNCRPSQSVSVSVNGVQNTLSSASDSYFYKNENNVFTYAAPYSGNNAEMKLTLEKGEYEITDIRCFLGNVSDGTSLYQSEFVLDASKTKGNCICGHIDVQRNGYFITSIPFDENFEVTIDGKRSPVERVNTAFLGFAVAEGEHEIEIIYHAPGAAAGRMLSLLGILLAAMQIKIVRFWKSTFGRRGA